VILAEAVGAASPDTWAGIMERVGIPAAFLLLVLVFGSACVLWFLRNVVKPVTASHLSFVKQTGGAVEKLGGAVEKLATNETRQTEILHELKGAVQDLKSDMVQVRDSVDGLEKDVRQVKGMIGKQLRGKPDNGCAE
jgi:hypothetical protein